MRITIFYIPTGSAEEANKLGQVMIEKKLAACSNVFPIQSMYPWDGQLQHDEEHVLLLKTFPQFREKLQAAIEQHHSYKVPCIMQWETDVNETYGNWMKEMLDNRK